MNETPTGIEAAVCNDIAERQQKGIAKYGVTVADNPLTLKQWLQHAYEETLDKAVYLKRAIAEIDATGPLPSAANQWQPIETAPMDGTYVVVWPPSYTGVTSCAKWDNDEYAKKPRPYWYRTDAQTNRSRELTPTHWMRIDQPVQTP